MQPHQERVLNEAQELRWKIDKLHGFIQSEMFTRLSEEEQERLSRQANHMLGYWHVLKERIDAF